MHLAAECYVDRSIDGPADFIQTNIVGTNTLLEAARRYRDLIPFVKDRPGHHLRYAIDASKILRELGWAGLGWAGLGWAGHRSKPSSRVSARRLSGIWTIASGGSVC